MVDALETGAELQGSFDMDAERTYVDGVRTRVQGREVTDHSRHLVGADCRIHLLG